MEQLIVVAVVSAGFLVSVAAVVVMAPVLLGPIF